MGWVSVANAIGQPTPKPFSAREEGSTSEHGLPQQ